VRIGYTAATVAAALAFTLSSSTVAGRSSAPARSPHLKLASARVARVFPRRVFPLLGRPEYGDGLNAGRGHQGQDLLIAAGTPEVAVADSVVLETGNSGGRGNFISLYDPVADRTYNYFHMLEPALAGKGQHVREGQKVGEVGCTGSCWGDHLHFELRAGRNPYGPVLNPTPLLHRLEAEPRSPWSFRL
jgi:murein DD-endopeptidase MepM/ murein hydrolase activator NlpD